MLSLFPGGCFQRASLYSAVYIPPKNVSSKRYLLQQDFIEKILNAKDVRVKLDLSRSYVEGIFSDDTMSSAKLAFSDFMKKLNASLKK